MKRILLAALAASVMTAGSASAADMAARPMVTKAAPVAPMVNWSGFYAAVGGGYGMASTDSTLVTDPAGAFVANDGSIGGKGYFGRVQLGYDYQFLPSWVAGVFADYDFSDIKGTALSPLAGATTNPWSQKSAWAAGGRIGYLVTPQVLSYFDGGYSASKFNGGELSSAITGAPVTITAGNQRYSGYFLGGGTEMMLGLLGPGWFVKSEYRYASYSSKNIPITLDATGASILFAQT